MTPFDFAQDEQTGKQSRMKRYDLLGAIVEVNETLVLATFTLGAR